jgi:chemotaxis response regulator CheB
VTQLKRDLRTCDIPVIFISALADVEDKLTAFHHGCVDYVTKPFHIAEVLARIETHLALRRLQAQLQEANRKFARELALAGTVQCGFLPGGAATSARLAVCRPAPAGARDVWRLLRHASRCPETASRSSSPTWSTRASRRRSSWPSA